MSFHTRRLRSRPPLHPWRRCKQFFGKLQNQVNDFSPKTRSYAVGFFLILIGIIVVFKVMGGLYTWISNIKPEDVLSAVGSDLKKDQYGYTNLILLGDGGHVRDGADLIDTIMVASIDYQKNAVTLFSIPRDYYVQQEGVKTSRINELYRNHKNGLGEEKAFELFQDVVGKVTNLEIHYYMRLDFNAFVEVVDALGGIEINIPTTIDDPYYPTETDDGYSPFYIAAGPQQLDGETALKYVRSRKTTSDFDRAARQQLVLDAIQQKALSREVLTDPGTLKDLYQGLKDHINTNISVREMLSLAGFAKGFDRSRLVRKVIHDDPGQEGGFLYTPDQESVGGKFVLVPFGDSLELIHRYADLIFHKRQLFFNPPKIEVLNASKRSGIARNTAYQLTRFGFQIENIDNLVDAAGERSYSDKTIIRYYNWEIGKSGHGNPKNPLFLQTLQSFINADELVPADPTTQKNGVEATIVIGETHNIFLVD